MISVQNYICVRKHNIYRKINKTLRTFTPSWFISIKNISFEQKPREKCLGFEYAVPFCLEHGHCF